MKENQEKHRNIPGQFSNNKQDLICIFWAPELSLHIVTKIYTYWRWSYSNNLVKINWILLVFQSNKLADEVVVFIQRILHQLSGKI